MSLRSRIKALEFRLPPAAARAGVRLLGGRLQSFRAEDDALQAIFIHVPKVAGSSVCRALFEARPRHIPLSRYLASDPERFHRYFKFAFVRNPWERLHSAYSYLHGAVGRQEILDGRWASRHLADKPDFASFVAALARKDFRREVLDWTHFRPQLDWLRIPGRAGHACDFVGHYEHLDADFARVCARLGVQRELPVLRRSKRDSYRDAYDAGMVARVAELYDGDIREFGYGFDRAPARSPAP